MENGTPATEDERSDKDLQYECVPLAGIMSIRAIMSLANCLITIGLSKLNSVELILPSGGECFSVSGKRL